MLNLLKPGMNFIQMKHDLDCPSIDSQSAADCTCKPDLGLVSEKAWISGIQKDRKARRKAAREAEKALRKMRGGK